MTKQEVRLTKAQLSALRALEEHDGWRSAYPGLRLGTLNSLSLRNLVQAHHENGSMFSPHNAIKWRITPAGRSALSRLTGEGNG